MKTNIFIPKKIKIGFQNRSDTYTQKLAYIIYYDEKGVLRKETSWNGWRDKNIPDLDFDNVPTSGFVLNKKVGDYYGGWDGRQAYIRIYDPRDFEFEITVNNLLYILENTNCIKGKGLDGDFVYAWDGKDLLLVPTSSPDYIEITKYNEIVHKNEYIKTTDLILGGTYKTKDNDKWIYMGRFDYHTKKSEKVDVETRWGRSYEYKYTKVNKGKHHFFVREHEYYADNTPYFQVLILKSLGNKFIEVVSSQCVNNYAELFEKLEHRTEYSPIDESKDEYIPYTFDEFIEQTEKYSPSFIYESSNKYYKMEIHFDNKQQAFYTLIENGSHWNNNRNYIGTAEEIYNKYKPRYKNVYLQNGKFYEKIHGRV
jgi:hypothetical protein